ncbi:hypothetical protein [Streptomyces sp. NPDC017524]|uniref:hypothetical protein n=1 Tax=unclassified Streptomyces TaxID=2593676 RepID=UPI0037AF8C56
MSDVAMPVERDECADAGADHEGQKQCETGRPDGPHLDAFDGRFEELVEIAWATQGEIVHYVLFVLDGLFEPVQAYLAVALLQRFSPQA